MGLLYEGQDILGKYDVETLIAEGAFGEVYRVKHRFFGRQAMKVFKTVGMTIEETEQRLGEASMLSKMEHPNIVRVFDAGTTGTSKGICGFFTMEFVPGGNLHNFWCNHKDKLIPVETVVDIVQQVCRGLDVAHSKTPPIIHRDIKPQNVLIGYDSAGLRVRLSDFGLAKNVNPLTLRASAKGDPIFKAPEVFHQCEKKPCDCQKDSCAGDVWALGTILYLLLTDRMPFSELGDLGIIDRRLLDKPLIPPSRLNVCVNQLLDEITLRALSVKPEARYPSAREMLVDLDKWENNDKSHKTSTKVSQLSGASKDILGEFTVVNKEQAEKMVKEAINLSYKTGKLPEAADILEEALNKWPDFRQQYEYRIKLWRCGKAM
ncbi:serine/threonine protein kinase [Candidatus Magnetominusculus xianensis]|uniref:Serine/threonine protein kinase n=1 Tax=Candidatus Magnetominusculus xianensis TaxID=1748249 RepID=A0ABR5SJZ1_9BACT|nr:serine/threonine-protein kinase [Candidatus Magnetominusculus xianensis]KWT95156.1 serine/threonine protein kinase [Candidatus Magnetominusculus xianensis]MBF0402803.1 serine/threonine protein kinase [Nitrospirota bacterium]